MEFLGPIGLQPVCAPSRFMVRFDKCTTIIRVNVWMYYHKTRYTCFFSSHKPTSYPIRQGTQRHMSAFPLRLQDTQPARTCLVQDGVRGRQRLPPYTSPLQVYLSSLDIENPLPLTNLANFQAIIIKFVGTIGSKNRQYNTGKTLGEITS